MRVLVAGAGAIGQWLGARLSSRHDVTLLLRPRHKAAIEAHGLHVTGHTRFAGQVACITEPEGRYDAAFVTCKAYDAAALAERIAPRAELLCSLQNGFGNGQKLARHAPGRVAVALTSHGVGVEGPGRIVHAGTGATKVGPFGEEAAARTAQTLLADAGLDPIWCPDLRGQVWQKALVNAGINPVAGLERVPNGRLWQDDTLRARCVRLVEEGVGLARRAGVRLPEGDLAETALQVCRDTAENRCSMLQDLQARRRTEVEQITGRLVRLARRLDVPLPHNEAAYAQVKEQEVSYLGEPAARQGARDEAVWEQEPF